jgi:hypothetical protein
VGKLSLTVSRFQGADTVPQNRAGIGIEVCLCGRDPIEPLEKRSLQFTNARPQCITCGFDSWPLYHSVEVF